MLDEQIQNKKQEIQQKEKEQRRRGKILANVRMCLFLFFLCLLVLAWRKVEYRLHFLGAAVVLAIIFLAVAAFHSRVEEEEKRLGRCLSIIADYEKRAEGRWHGFPENGSDFIDTENEDLTDLNVLGKHSIFQFLNISRTKSGKRRLVHSLTNPPADESEWHKTQRAVQELKGKFEFALHFQEILGRTTRFENIDFEEDLFPSAKGFLEIRDKIFLAIGVILALLTDVSLVLLCCRILPFSYLGLLVLISLGYNHLYAAGRKDEYGKALSFSHVFGAFDSIYRYVLEQDFESEKLRELAEQLSVSRNMVRKLEKMMVFCRCRDNWLSYLLFNPLFSLNIVVLYWYRRILRQENGELRQGVLALEEIEKLIALTGICWAKHEICLPECTASMKIETTRMRHPLLQEEKCVANDFSCGEKILIITGSNMSGKSSFMRMVGINMALMNAGTYVNAKAFRAPFMKIAASIGIQDDISQGISTFYGELMRMKKIFHEAEENELPMMIFIDEIFKGTNYNDRIFGAKVIVDKLGRLGGIAMITTHDFELCDIDDPKIENYHFAETYEGRNIVFDYKIKKGRCQTTNARYLMEQVGLLEESVH